MIEVKRNNDKYTIEVDDTFIVIAREELLILEACIYECLKTGMNCRYTGVEMEETQEFNFDRDGAMDALGVLNKECEDET